MDISKFKYNPVQEQILDVLNNKANNHENNVYHRLLISWFFAQMSTQMHTHISTKDRGKLPTNMYVLLTGESGLGKGLSLNFLEDNIVNKFKKKFLQDTFPTIAGQSITSEAQNACIVSGKDFELEEARVLKEYEACGEYPYSFDSGTAAAFKQIRTKAQIAKIGSLNLVIDEIGTNLLNNTELFGVYLENFDKSKIKAKIIKNTNESKRGKERDYPVPSNLLCFGTPFKLFDGGKVEQELDSLLGTGYARRMFFGIGYKPPINTDISAKTRFENLTNTNDITTVSDISTKLQHLASAANYGRSIYVPDHISILFIEYQIWCEKRAEKIPAYSEAEKAELLHRYFKALKLAGNYAFIDIAPEVSIEHAQAAILLTEDSGACFGDFINKEKAFVKLANYLANLEEECTYADLEKLPFYTGNSQNKKDMLNLAISYGYKNNIIIKKLYANSVELLIADSLKKTSLFKMVLSMSDDIATNYENHEIPFDQLHLLTQEDGYHWCNHKSIDGRRKEDHMEAGFNMVVLDVDGGTSIPLAQLLLKEYTYHLYETKRSTSTDNRFRIVIPISHTLVMNSTEYKEFMNNIYNFLPFNVDTQTNQRSRKWLSCNKQYYYNEGELLDVMPFIPKTVPNTQRQSQLKELSDLTNLERWFALRMSEGNRNCELLRYGMMLVDSGRDLLGIQTAVMELNDKLKEPLNVQEIQSTIFKSLGNKVLERKTV